MSVAFNPSSCSLKILKVLKNGEINNLFAENPETFSNVQKTKQMWNNTSCLRTECQDILILNLKKCRAL